MKEFALAHPYLTTLLGLVTVSGVVELFRPRRVSDDLAKRIADAAAEKKATS